MGVTAFPTGVARAATRQGGTLHLCYASLHLETCPHLGCRCLLTLQAFLLLFADAAFTDANSPYLI